MLTGFFLTAMASHSQNHTPISILKQSGQKQKNERYSIAISKNQNEFELVFSGLFVFYKSFFSSQDIPGACSFSPSCSEYGLISVKKYGIFRGILSTFDRLTRCHGMSSGNYSVDIATGKFIDMP